jgi:predicted acylesterase/phospholipase RssA
MTTAIVLSGGGAKGDFQVGAVRCFYDRGNRPDLLCGVSVGAVNAIKLAEGEDPVDPRRGLPGLEALWAGLQVNGDMYVDADWLHDPKMDPRVRDFLKGQRHDLGIAGPPDRSEWGDLAIPIGWIEGLAFLVGDGQALLESLDVIQRRARSLFLLSPIQAKLASELDTSKVAAWVAQGHRLRLGMVGLESGRLRWVTETGQVLERDGSPVADRGSTPAACQPLADDVAVLEDEIRGLQDDLRDAAPGAKGAIATQIKAAQRRLTQARALVEACLRSQPADPARADLRTAVLASASIPGIFLPVSIAGETYVDGGVREVLPLQVAVELGADVIFAVNPSRPDLQTAGSFASAGISAITARSLTEILVNEVSSDDARPSPPQGRAMPQVFLVQPDVDLHDITTIDPGLIQMSRDYGYMRAADVLGGVDRSSRRWVLPTEIALLRREIWGLENQRWGHEDPTRPGEPAPPADASLQTAIDQRKARLQALIEERQGLGGPMPAGIDGWSSALERHPWALNDARFIQQSLPVGPPAPGSTVAVSVTMRNTGTTTWQAQEGYALGSQSPQDNANWGLNRAPLPGPVPPAALATFSFSATVPPPPSAVFQWRMVQDGVEWFGESTPEAAVQIAEPAACPSIRGGISEGLQEIQQLQASLQGLDPRDPADRLEIRQVQKQVETLRRQVDQLRDQGRQLGCAALP